MQLTNATDAKIREYRTKLRDGRTRKAIEKKLALLGKLLIEKYGVNSDDQFFVLLEEDAA